MTRRTAAQVTGRGRVWRVAITAAATLAAFAPQIAHADEADSSTPPVPTTVVAVDDAVIAVDEPVVAVGLPPVPSTTVVVAVDDPPVPPTTAATTIATKPTHASGGDVAGAVAASVAGAALAGWQSA